ncbi:unnamed protein product [Chondrus crispus]|uniref:Uncharacterized protein n=1 Tax=Chondrus crispus TaxID=2769 RepID=R7QSD5_CHOCR|nr:unnamed protein product [Chondrus crispus]CDF40653.1 unnamed protein product [Chondrus crispus]|eukprot:XP_005710947.1 unnamed protein product [Chondrus crispus]
MSSSPPNPSPSAAVKSEQPLAISAGSEALEYVPAPSVNAKKDQTPDTVAQAQPPADKKEELASSPTASNLPEPDMSTTDKEKDENARNSAEQAAKGQVPEITQAESKIESETEATSEKVDTQITPGERAEIPPSTNVHTAMDSEKNEVPTHSPTGNGAAAPSSTLADNSDDKATNLTSAKSAAQASDSPSETAADNPNEKTSDADAPEEKKPSEDELQQSASETPNAESSAPSTSSRKRSRRLSTKASALSPVRTLRPRASTKPLNVEADAARPDAQAVTVPEIVKAKSESSVPKTEPSLRENETDAAATNANDANTGEDETDDKPRPVMTEKGLRMVVGDSVFVTADQLEDIKRQRMRGKNLKPIEELTFQDILSYNRDQLRCYCYIYSTPRRKKSEMEVDMARFVSLWNEGKPGFVFAEYIPKNSGRMDASAFVHRLTTNDRSSASRAQQSAGGQNSTEAMKGLPADNTPGKPIGGAHPKSSTKTPPRTSVRASPPAALPASAKRPPPRPASIQPSPIRPNLPPRPPSSERLVGALPTNQSSFPTQASGSGAGRNSAGSSSKSGRTSMPVQNMPQGYNTSHKQKMHARTAGIKFKAAYNGAGPAIVHIVENAAAYFEGKDSAEVISDRAKSYERYQLNVDLLTEIFDGPLSDFESDDNSIVSPGKEIGHTEIRAEGEAVLKDVHMVDVNGNDIKAPEEVVSQQLAKRMDAKARGDVNIDMEAWEQAYRKAEKLTQESDRTNMRLFQRLERAESEQEIETVRRDFERENDIRLPGAPPPLIRRKLDKSLPAMQMPDNKCNILRFKVA